MRANDGKCDALGRLWVGSLDEEKKRQGALYCLDTHGSDHMLVTQKAEGAMTGNGLAWSPDYRIQYWADTSSHVVRAWNFDLETGHLREERNFMTFQPKPDGWTFKDTSYAGRPDGAAVDVQGNYWVAMYEGRRICKFAPDGRLLEQIATPVQCPTMPCFGGEDLRTLYLTSARHGRTQAELETFPDSGAVFSLRVDNRGLEVQMFEDRLFN